MINVQLETDTGNFKDKPSTTDVSVNMTKLQIATGTDDFKELRSTSDVFVDKTLFIKNIIDTIEKAILIMRPRRWGKTLNLDMLLKFLAIEVDDKGERVEINSNKVFFEGGTINIKRNKTKDLAPLKIAEIGGEYMEDQGDYPVIFVNLKDVRARTYNEVVAKLKNMIAKIYMQHEYLQNSIKLTKCAKDKFKQYMFQDYENHSIEDSICFLSELLYKHHKQRVYILVDEYDKPVNFFVEHGLDYATEDRKQTAELITGIMSACGKTNPYLEKIVLTGIFDAFAKEGGSGFNNLDVHDISNNMFGGDFGFSEGEITQLLSKAKLSESLISTISDWYNGYTLTLPDQSTIKGYTPWSVMKYIQAAVRGCIIPESYWHKSGINWILNSLSVNDAVINTLNEMCDAKDGTVFDILSSDLLEYIDQGNNKSLVGYLLFHSGYITKKKYEVYKEKPIIRYGLPNKEVEISFKKTILNKWLSKELNLNNKDSLLEAMHNSLHNCEQFTKVVQRYILDKINGAEAKTESYFQNCIDKGLELYDLQYPTESKFQVFSEKSIEGKRMDHIFYPIRSNSDNVVIIHEYKRLNKTTPHNVSKALNDALHQMCDREYFKEPLSKKEQYPKTHDWTEIRMRALIFVRDEVRKRWHAFSGELSVDLSQKPENKMLYDYVEEQFNHALDRFNNIKKFPPEGQSYKKIKKQTFVSNAVSENNHYNLRPR